MLCASLLLLVNKAQTSMGLTKAVHNPEFLLCVLEPSAIHSRLLVASLPGVGADDMLLLPAVSYILQDVLWTPRSDV